MATVPKLSGVTAVSGNVINLNGTNATPGLSEVRLDRGWSPRTANRRASQLGGELYEEGADIIPLLIDGSSADEVLITIDAIRAAIDQGHRWHNGQESTAVLVEYAVDGSTASAVKTPLLGAPVGVQFVVTLGTDFNEVVKSYTARIQINIVTKGRWVGTTDSVTAAAAQTMPVMQQLTMGSTATVPSLTKATFSFSSGSTGSTGSGFVALTGTEDGIYFGEAESMTPLYGSTEADTDASGGSVLKMGATGDIDKSWNSGVSINSNARYFAVFACMKNTHASDYRVSAYSTATGYTDYIRVPAGSDPAVYLIGTLATNIPMTYIQLNVINTGAIDSGNPLRIDYYVIVALSENSTVIAIDTLAGNSSSVEIDHNYLTEPKPAVINDISGGSPIRRGYRGIATFNTVGSKISGILMATAGSAWGLHSAGSTKYSNQLTIDRMATYLTPR